MSPFTTDQTALAGHEVLWNFLHVCLPKVKSFSQIIHFTPISPFCSFRFLRIPVRPGLQKRYAKSEKKKVPPSYHPRRFLSTPLVNEPNKSSSLLNQDSHDLISIGKNKKLNPTHTTTSHSLEINTSTHPNKPIPSYEIWCVHPTCTTPPYNPQVYTPSGQTRARPQPLPGRADYAFSLGLFLIQTSRQSPIVISHRV